jgi:hypothetical protein
VQCYLFVFYHVPVLYRRTWKLEESVPTFYCCRLGRQQLCCEQGGQAFPHRPGEHHHCQPDQAQEHQGTRYKIHVERLRSWTEFLSLKMTNRSGLFRENSEI